MRDGETVDASGNRARCRPQWLRAPLACRAETAAATPTCQRANLSMYMHARETSLSMMRSMEYALGKRARTWGPAGQRQNNASSLDRPTAFAHRLISVDCNHKVVSERPASKTGGHLRPFAPCQSQLQVIIATPGPPPSCTYQERGIENVASGVKANRSPLNRKNPMNLQTPSNPTLFSNSDLNAGWQPICTRRPAVGERRKGRRCFPLPSSTA